MQSQVVKPALKKLVKPWLCETMIFAREWLLKPWFSQENDFLSKPWFLWENDSSERMILVRPRSLRNQNRHETKILVRRPRSLQEQAPSYTKILARPNNSLDQDSRKTKILGEQAVSWEQPDQKPRETKQLARPRHLAIPWPGEASYTSRHLPRGTNNASWTHPIPNGLKTLGQGLRPRTPTQGELLLRPSDHLTKTQKIQKKIRRIYNSSHVIGQILSIKNGSKEKIKI